MLTQRGHREMLSKIWEMKPSSQQNFLIGIFFLNDGNRPLMREEAMSYQRSISNSNAH